MLKKIAGAVVVAVSASTLFISGLDAQDSPFKPDTSRPLIAAAEYERGRAGGSGGPRALTRLLRAGRGAPRATSCSSALPSPSSS